MKRTHSDTWARGCFGLLIALAVLGAAIGAFDSVRSLLRGGSPVSDDAVRVSPTIRLPKPGAK